MSFTFFLAVPVWGETYVDTFLNASLPTLMAQGNLPYLSTVCKLKFTIYTSAHDQEMIKQHKLIQQFSKLPNTELLIEILSIPNRDDFTNSHDYGTDLYRLKSFAYKNNFIHAAQCENTGVAISLNADIIFSADFLRNAHSILLDGRKVIEVVGPRGKANEIRGALESKRTLNGEIEINASELLEIWIDNIHDLMNIHMWEGETEIFNSSHILWPIPGAKGWLARCFYLYPIIAVIPKTGVEFSGTIDSDLVKNCGYRFDDIEVLTNHSDMFCCELSEDDKFVGDHGIRNNLENLAWVFSNHGNEYNMFLLKHYISLGINYDHKQWHTTAIKSNQVIDGVNKIMFEPEEEDLEETDEGFCRNTAKKLKRLLVETAEV